jgi:hypothetical protein
MKILYYITKTISYILLAPIAILAIPGAIFYFISDSLEEYIFSKKYNSYDYVEGTIIDLTYEERYDIWFKNNYETGMEKNYDIVPNFEDGYYIPTPKQKTLK